MVKCQNCGAKISKKDTECPYCGAMQYEASEKEYMNKLYKINDKMDVLDEQAKGIIVKKLFINLAFVFAAILLAIGIGFLIGYGEYNNYSGRSEAKRISKAINWFDNNYDKLNELYADRDFEGISDIIDAGRKSGMTSDITQLWEHYGVYRVYSNYYKYTKNYIDRYNEYGKSDDASGRAFEYAYEYCVTYLYNVDPEYISANKYRDVNYNDLSREDKRLIDTWTKEIFDFLSDVGISENQIRDDIREIYFDNASGTESTYDKIKNKAKAYNERLGK